MHITIGLSPLLHALNWLSYLNGTAHLSTMKSGFAGRQTWDEVELATRLGVEARPDVLARGMLGMMNYDARKILPEIQVPVLIVSGDKDSTTKPEASREMQSAIPNARLQMLSPAKHMGLIEHHETFAKLAREFVHATHSTRDSAEANPARYSSHNA